MLQMAAFQVKSMFLEVTMHFFHPHPASISRHRQAQSGQVGRQQPWFFFTQLAVRQQIDPIGVLLGEPLVASSASCSRYRTFNAEAARPLDALVAAVPASQWDQARLRLHQLRQHETHYRAKENILFPLPA
jgi:hypothetical protein